MYIQTKKLFEQFVEKISKKNFIINKLRDNSNDDISTWYTSIEIQKLLKIYSSKFYLNEEIFENNNITLFWKFKIGQQIIQISISFLDELCKPINFNKSELDMGAICRELSNYPQLAKANIFFQIVDKSKKHFMLVNSSSLLIKRTMTSITCKYIEFNQKISKAIENLSLIIIEIWIYTISKNAIDKVQQIVPKIVKYQFSKIIKDVICRQIEKKHQQQQSYLRKKLNLQQDLTLKEKPQQIQAKNFQKIKQIQQLQQVNLVYMCEIGEQQLEKRVISTLKHSPFIIERIQLQTIFKVMDTVQSTYLNHNFKQIPSKKLLHVRIPNDEQLQNIYKNKDQLFITKRKEQLKKKMKRTIKNIKYYRYYKKRRPEIYLFSYKELYVDMEASSFLMSQCGNQIDIDQQTEYSQIFYSRLCKIVSVGITLLDIQECNIINGNFKTINFYTKNQNSRMTVFTNFYQSRKLSKDVIKFDYLSITRQKGVLKAKKIQKLNKLLTQYCKQSWMNQFVGNIQKNFQQTKQSNMSDYFIKNSLAIILMMLHGTTQQFLPVSMKKLQKKIRKFLKEEIHMISISQAQVNTLLGRYYDFEGYIQIINSLLLRYFTYPLNQYLDKKSKQALERINLLVQIIQQKLKTSEPSKHISIEKVVMILQMITTLAKPFGKLNSVTQI